MNIIAETLNKSTSMKITKWKLGIDRKQLYALKDEKRAKFQNVNPNEQWNTENTKVNKQWFSTYSRENLNIWGVTIKKSENLRQITGEASPSVPQ